MNSDGSSQQQIKSFNGDGSTIISPSETDEYFDIYTINKDGSFVKKIIDNSSKASWLK